MKYNKSLDYMAVALQAAMQGKVNTAASLFLKAATHPSAKQAMAILDHSNTLAFKELEASKKKAVKAGKRRLKASDDLSDELVAELEDLEASDEYEDLDASDEDEDDDFDDDEDEIDAGDDCDEEEVSAHMAKILKSMVKRKSR